MRVTLVDDYHHVRHIEELDNHLDGKIGAGRWWSEEHHGLGRRELLLLGAPGPRKLLRRVVDVCMCHFRAVRAQVRPKIRAGPCSLSCRDPRHDTALVFVS